MGLVPGAQGGVELGRVDAGEQASHRREARRSVLAVAPTHAQAFEPLGAEVVDPFADGLVAAHRAQGGGGGEREHGGERMAPALAVAGVVDGLEELGKGAHRCGGEHHLGDSVSQAGVERGGAQPARPGTGDGRTRAWAVHGRGRWSHGAGGGSRGCARPRSSSRRGRRTSRRASSGWAKRADQSWTKRRVHSDSTREPRLRGAPGRSRNREWLVSRCSRSSCTAKLQPFHRSRAAHFSAGAENTTSASHWPR